MSGFFSTGLRMEMAAVLPHPLLDTGALRVEKNGDVVVNFYVLPNSAVTQVTGLYASTPRASIRLKLQAAPVDGKANAALRKWLAKCLGVPQGMVELVRGDTSQHKQLKVSHTATADWAALVALLVKAGV